MSEIADRLIDALASVIVALNGWIDRDDPWDIYETYHGFRWQCRHCPGWGRASTKHAARRDAMRHRLEHGGDA